jgi:hypothetical protein
LRANWISRGGPGPLEEYSDALTKSYYDKLVAAAADYWLENPCPAYTPEETRQMWEPAWRDGA